MLEQIVRNLCDAAVILTAKRSSILAAPIELANNSPRALYQSV